MKTERFFYLISISSLLFITGLLYKNEGNFYGQTHTESTVNLSGGDYIRFVFIGSSTCSFSNNDRLHEMVNYLKKNVEKIANHHSVNFISTGISNDVHSQHGLNYLRKTMPYHEIIVGSSTYNLGIIQYSSGAPTTPQILIMYENYDNELLGINIHHLINSQHLIKSYTGVFEIEQFYDLVKSASKEKIFDAFGI